MSGGRTRYVRFAWGTLWFTLVVVLWGGLVSATGAGDGCGDSWPLCVELLAESGTVSRLDTLIELTHRLTSGLALLAVVAMVVWARRIYPDGHRARFWASAGLAFMVIESLIGAALVVFRLVDMNVLRDADAHMPPPAGNLIMHSVTHHSLKPASCGR